jgi:hypothetical protein
MTKMQIEMFSQAGFLCKEKIVELEVKDFTFSLAEFYFSLKKKIGFT